MKAVSVPLAARAWIRGKSVWGRLKDTLIGRIWLMVTSGVVLPLTDTRLPGCNRIGPVLPSTGERIWVNSRLSRAASTMPLSDVTSAASDLAAASDWSRRCWAEIAF